MSNESYLLKIHNAIKELNEKNYEIVKNIIHSNHEVDGEMLKEVLKILAKYENQYTIHSELYVNIIMEINQKYPKKFLQLIINLFNCHTLRRLYERKIFDLEDIHELYNLSDSIRIALAPEFNTPTFTKLLLPHISMRRFHELKQSNWKLFIQLLNNVFIKDTVEYSIIYGNNSVDVDPSATYIRDELISQYSYPVSYKDFIGFYETAKPRTCTNNNELPKATDSNIITKLNQEIETNAKHNSNQLITHKNHISGEKTTLTFVTDSYLFDHGTPRPQPQKNKKLLKKKCLPKIPIRLVIIVFVLVGFLFLVTFLIVRHYARKYIAPLHRPRNIYGGNHNFDL